MSTRDLLDAPPVLDLLTAAKALGIGRTTAYALARSGRFPCRIIPLGSTHRPTYRVPTADLHRLLGLTPKTPAGSDPEPATGEPDEPGGLSTGAGLRSI